MNNLKLVTTQKFGCTSCDFWTNIDGEFYVPKEQIGKALGYEQPVYEINQLHKSYKELFDRYCIKDVDIDENGNNVDVELYSKKGIMEICKHSGKDTATEFLDWCWKVIDNFSHNGGDNLSFLVKHMDILISSVRQLEKQLADTQDKVEKLELLVSTPIEYRDYKWGYDVWNWKISMSDKIKALSKEWGYNKDEIKSIYGDIYKIMKRRYGVNIDKFKKDYSTNHRGMPNISTMDIISEYPELRELFEYVLDNFLKLNSEE